MIVQAKVSSEHFTLYTETLAVAVHWKTLLAVLACLPVSALPIGCNGGDEASRTPGASINNQGKGIPSQEGEDGPAANQPDSDPQHPLVLIETSLGNITVRLDAQRAPLTVDNFLAYVDASHYDDTIVHQVYKDQGFVAGGYDTRSSEKPTRTPVRNEADNGLKNLRGTISMVRFPDAIDSAASQFFVNVSDNPALDHKDRTPEGYGYCVFGEVVEGMEVVDKINEVPVQDTEDFERTPVTPVVVHSIRRIR